MTADPVDLDLLADHLAGVLDGTPEGARVSALIHADPDWAAARERLVAADRRVRADLAAQGAQLPPLPSALAARLDAALAGEAPHGPQPAAATPAAATPADATPADATATAATATAATPAPAPRTPPDHRPPSRLAGRPRGRGTRRRTRITVAAVAAALVAVVAGVVTTGQLTTKTSNSTAGMNAPAAGSASRAMGSAATPPAGAVAPGAAGFAISGRNYTPATLAQAGAGVSGLSGPSAAAASGALPTGTVPGGPVPAGLARLADPAARDTCLAAVTSRYGGQVVWGDYARFQGDPALVVVLVDNGANGVRRVVAVGPGCGVPAGHTDTLATAGG